ncbi:MAG: hypothetical protein A2Z21_00970 [Candidatus Fraserbacteria bacterium RBG_16_55_9]|uniref:DinB-like domain-containing protein n=1 Tax=Fraserbacteria sp. (strain RBG_16_55_9) TaxID=1817864 RepID=A0A1F5UUB2_FRAXR|nr:MAG: hypothetical protein A2Z21_00970 [Candidatus Fraserbacteria bacterium RBG_16_55_9]
MNFQERVIQMTSRNMEDLFRSARAVPKDKLEWKPVNNGRSALDQLQECAQAPTWFLSMLETRKPPQFDKDLMEKARAERATWKTIDECENVCRKNSERLFEVIKKFPDKDLDVKIALPFGKGMVMSMADIAMAHYWNTTYHLGQINFIQTLYGDLEMH